jgi:hypothetical protein
MFGLLERQSRRGKINMDQWMVWISLFTAGAAVGALVTSSLPRLRQPKKRRTDLVQARSRILAGVKEKHDQEILREIFQAKEALSGELSKSLRVLRASTERLLGEVRDDSERSEQTRLL